MAVPFFRPSIGSSDIDAVVACLESGWLTSGPRTREFEELFADYVGARHGIALSSCTAALHLALAAIDLQRDELVLVPTMTFPATVEVIRYFDAVPVLVDSEPQSLCIDPVGIRETIEAIEAGRPVAGLKPPYGKIRAVIPVHYGGQMADMGTIRCVAEEYGLAVIEDAAHALPAAYRRDSDSPWSGIGTTGDITCFSFYANKCITTGEGGMAVTDSAEWAEKIRRKSLHGLSADAWSRFHSSNRSSWEYEVVTSGFKYNLTDIASSLGIEQLKRADTYLEGRRRVATAYRSSLSFVDGITLPAELENRRHAWHLFAIRWEQQSGVGRNQFIRELAGRGIGSSVHWKPLHLHTLYREQFGYGPGLFPVSERVCPTLVSLPIFPGMSGEEIDEVVTAIMEIRKEPCAGPD